MKVEPFEKLLEHVENGWFPLWVGYPDDTPELDDCLTIDWVCTWRVPDGKFFSTQSNVTPKQVAEFKERLSRAWDHEKEKLISKLTEEPRGNE